VVRVVHLAVTVNTCLANVALVAPIGPTVRLTDHFAAIADQRRQFIARRLDPARLMATLDLLPG
jgi:hypothetical protein